MPGAPRLSFLESDLQALSSLHEATVVPHFGSAAVSVPLTVSASRSDFGPRLTLDYDSAGGNSAFGIGWSLAGLLTLSRNTRRGLPRYDQTDGYVLSGVGELVPALEENASDWQPRVDDRGAFWVRHYRARVDTSQVRVERWIEKATARDHWRTRDVRNVVTVYGLGASRIADPADPSRTFAWLPEAQFDPLGNAIVFEYARENLHGVDLARASERRQATTTPAGLPQQYLKRVRYGNTRPLQADAPVPPDNAWRFEMVFDYGDHSDPLAPTPEPDRQWPVRLDPHSTFAPGFEVRTYRLCRRVLSFHSFDALGPAPVLVGSYVLGGDESAAGSVLTSVTYTGSRRNAATGELQTRSLPPLRFDYACPSVAQSFQPAPADAEVNVPGGLGIDHRWVDLFGEGLPGILAETHHAWYYKPNEGGGHFAAQQIVLERPAYRLGQCAVTDFDGDGNTNLAVLHGRLAGFYEYDRDAGGWTGFEPIAALPHAEGAGAKAQWVDLNGDGRADLVVADPQRLTWYPSEGKHGFGAPVEIQRPTEAPVVAPGGESLALDFFFADMNGDGLVDQVRVRNGRVEYWPHAGHGRFGDPILMEDSPVFAPDEEFDPRRVFLVDLDGNGAADILYVGTGEVRYWINACGNALIDGGRLPSLPYVDSLSTLRVVDFLGDGTSCLVWSSPLADRADAIQYLPLTDGIVPRLLVSTDNSMGQEVQFEYGSSARHYLRDKEAAIPWRTRLPSHRSVVEVKRVIDRIAGARTVLRYQYHDGCFDGDERVFRGFGFVEQFDTEAHDGTATSPEIAYTTPACVRTWYHTGREPFDPAPSRYTGDPLAALLPAQVVEQGADLLPGEADDAARALAGLMLRQEVFAAVADGTPAAHPFQVSQISYRVRRLQPSTGTDAGAQPASFIHYRAERLDDDYEQTSDDPRTTHLLTLDVDAHGTAVQRCRVAYPRRAGKPVESPAQQRLPIAVDTSVRLDVDEPDRYEPGIPVERRQYEVAGLTPGPASVFSWEALRAALPPLLAAPRRFDEELAGVTPEARLLEWERDYYWNDAGTAPLPLGTVGARTLPHHTEAACFTPQLIAEAYGGRVDASLLATDGAYEERDDHWWRRGSTIHYRDAQAFFQLARLERPDGAATRITYDADTLAVTEIEDALGNRVSGRIDYHVMAPDRITDANGYVSEVLYDPLGLVTVSTAQGQVLSDAGTPQPYGQDLLDVYVPRTDATFDAVLASPASFLQTAAEYILHDLDAWWQSGLPPRVVRLAREALRHDGTGSATTENPIQIGVSHFDGLQRVLQAKAKVGPGPALRHKSSGELELDAAGEPILEDAPERWQVTGHTIYNRKQQPVRQYEPFHTTHAAYEVGLAGIGVFGQFHYDALGRRIREELPNGTYTRVEYEPWRTTSQDPNDTVMDSLYRMLREPEPPGSPEKAALEKAKGHAGTPTVSHLDPQGREVKRVQVAGDGGDRVATTRLDIRGNPVMVTDARGLTAFRHVMDMLGRPCATMSADAGAVYSLLDVYDRPVHVWTARGVHERRSFDRLDRPTSGTVNGALGLNQVTERIIYGEDPSIVDAALRHLRGRAAVSLDQAGIVRVLQCAPSGQVLKVERQLAADYKREPAWSDPDAVALEPERYVTATVLDALGRLRAQSLPDGTTRQLEYLPGGGLTRHVITSADGRVTALPALDGAVFNARGQRTSARLGNGVTLSQEFDRETFRTRRITARRPSAGSEPGIALQDLRYVYDPAGNVTHCVDATQQPAVPGPFLQGLNVSPEMDYTYDAFYQLRQATGRVHQALLEHDYRPDVGEPGAMKGTRHLNFNNGAAVERYTRTFSYDLAGNLTTLVHTGTTRSWTTGFWVSPTSNRSLSALDPSGNPVSDPATRFDAAGNPSSLPYLRRLDWTYRNTLARAVVIDRASLGQPDDAEYYQYDSARMRTRKVAERLVAGAIEATETLYFDGCTITRIRAGGQLILERLTSHVSDGVNRIALIDRWTRDDLARETDDVVSARIRYQLANHLGSGQLEVDQTGAVVSYEEYFPFGVTSFVAGDNLREVARREYRFCGNERDAATGLYYVEHRYYAAWLARWLSPDPVGPEDDLNLYAYVLNDPINLVDPEGLNSDMPGNVGYMPSGLTGPYLEKFKQLSRAEQREVLTGRMGFIREEGGLRLVTRAEFYAKLAERAAGGDPLAIRLLKGAAESSGASQGEGGEVVFEEQLIQVKHDPVPSLLGAEDEEGRSVLSPTGASTGPRAPAGAEHGGDGREGGAPGPDGNAADGKGTPKSGSTDSVHAHGAGGDSSAAPAPGRGGLGGGSGPGLSPRPGPGHGADGMSANRAPGMGSGGPRGSGAGRHPGNRAGAGHGANGGDQRRKQPGDGGPGGGTRQEGPPGGTGTEPGGTRTDPGGVIGGVGTDIGGAPSMLPTSREGPTPLAPGQTVNSDDPSGSETASRSGPHGSDGRGRGVSPPGPSTGSGHGQGKGSEPSKNPGAEPLNELDYAVLLSSLLAPIHAGEQSRNGVSGGIPGGTGPAKAANPVVQWLYIAVNLAFTFAFEAIVGGLRRIGGAIGSGLKKIWSKIGPAVLEAVTAPAFLFLGVGLGGGSFRFAARARGLAEVAAIKAGENVKVAAKVAAEGREFVGLSGKAENPFLDMALAKQGHAEVNALGKAAVEVDTIGKTGEMWITETMCSGVCLSPGFGGNVPKAMEQMGLKELIVHTPTETVILTLQEGVVFYRTY